MSYIPSLTSGTIIILKPMLMFLRLYRKRRRDPRSLRARNRHPKAPPSRPIMTEQPQQRLLPAVQALQRSPKDRHKHKRKQQLLAAKHLQSGISQREWKTQRKNKNLFPPCCNIYIFLHVASLTKNFFIFYFEFLSLSLLFLLYYLLQFFSSFLVRVDVILSKGFRAFRFFFFFLSMLSPTWLSVCVHHQSYHLMVHGL